MSYASTVLNQMIIMAIYMLIGYLLSAGKKLTAEGNRGLTNVLLYVVLPSVIINSFLREPTPETTQALLIAFAAAAALLVVAMVAGRLMFPRNPVANFSTSFANVGFLGVPLVTAVLGSEYVIYAAGLVALMNVLQWTYGQKLLGGKGAPGGVKGLLLNPMMLALAAGLLVYFLRITPPKPVRGCITSLTACNAPIAMIIIGHYLHRRPLKEIFLCRSAYVVSFARLIAVSALSILLLFWMPWFSMEVKIALLIPAIAPVGSNVAIYAERAGLDPGESIAQVCLSTIFAIVTMPLMILLLTNLVH